MGEGETDREIAALEDSSSRKRKRNAAEDAAFEWIRKGCACARDGQTEREREGAKSFDDGSSSFLFTPHTPPRPHVRACARLNLAEVEDFQGKTCIAFYRRIDHLNNSQHGKPRPDSLCVPCVLLPLPSPSLPPYEFPPFLSLSVSLCPVPNRFLLHPPVLLPFSVPLLVSFFLL